MPFAQSCWNTSTSTPKAAATESRLSTIALTAITIDRNAASSNTKANASTNANTSGAVRCIESPKSFEIAVSPVTPASEATGPTVLGTSLLRSVESAAYEAALLPVPTIGSSTRATVRGRFTATVTGSWNCPPATARVRSALIAAWTRGVSTEGALTTTTAGAGSPGKAAWSRL